MAEIKLKQKIVDMASSYLFGWYCLQPFLEELVSVSWDDESMDDEAKELESGLELMATEVLEGLRPEIDFWREAQRIVREETAKVRNDSLIFIEPSKFPELSTCSSGASVIIESNFVFDYVA